MTSGKCALDCKERSGNGAAKSAAETAHCGPQRAVATAHRGPTRAQRQRRTADRKEHRGNGEPRTQRAQRQRRTAKSAAATANRGPQRAQRKRRTGPQRAQRQRRKGDRKERSGNGAPRTAKSAAAPAHVFIFLSPVVSSYAHLLFYAFTKCAPFC